MKRTIIILALIAGVQTAHAAYAHIVPTELPELPGVTMVPQDPPPDRTISTMRKFIIEAQSPLRKHKINPFLLNKQHQTPIHDLNTHMLNNNDQQVLNAQRPRIYR